MNIKWIVQRMPWIVIAIAVLIVGRSNGVSAPASISTMSRASYGAHTVAVNGRIEDAEQQEERLETWRERGVRFKGSWQPQEMALTLDVLDAFGALMGHDRLLNLLDAAVRARSFGFNRHLTLVRKPSQGLPAAVWYGLPGRIVLNDSLFDAQFVSENYAWSFLHGPYVTLPREIPMQEVIIAHEIGHVLIDGLHAEARSMGEQDLSLEALYEQIVPPAHWPHDGYVTNENLGTDLAVWALEVGRPAEVDALRTRLLPRFSARVAATP